MYSRHSLTTVIVVLIKTFHSKPCMQQIARASEFVFKVMLPVPELENCAKESAHKDVCVCT